MRAVYVSYVTGVFVATSCYVDRKIKLDKAFIVQCTKVYKNKDRIVDRLIHVTELKYSTVFVSSGCDDNPPVKFENMKDIVKENSSMSSFSELVDGPYSVNPQ